MEVKQYFAKVDGIVLEIPEGAESVKILGGQFEVKRTISKVNPKVVTEYIKIGGRVVYPGQLIVVEDCGPFMVSVLHVVSAHLFYEAT